MITSSRVWATCPKPTLHLEFFNSAWKICKGPCVMDAQWVCWVKKSYPACWWDRDLKGLLKDSLGWALEDFDRDLRRLGDISAQHFLRQISYRQAWRGKGWCGCECGTLVSLVCEGLRSTFSHVQRLQWRVSGGIDSVPNWKQQLCFLLSHSTIISERNDWELNNLIVTPDRWFCGVKPVIQELGVAWLLICHLPPMA